MIFNFIIPTMYMFNKPFTPICIAIALEVSAQPVETGRDIHAATCKD